MRLLARLLLALCVTLVAACSEPLPKDRLGYAGEWEGPGVYLLITPDGRCEYERKRGSNKVSIQAPIKEFQGDNFVVGLGPFTTTFVVSQPPRLDEGQWKMTVDGVELVRVTAFGETRT